MSSSRKRLRPLDPAEERSVTTSSWVRLSYLDDERSYCLSWPESPLTRFLSASTSYAATHIYHSHTETEMSARMSLSVAGTTATGRKPVPVPPVYRVSDLRQASIGEEDGGDQPECVAHLLSASNHSGPITMTVNSASEPHPLAPPRPHATTEDSILSLTCTQVQDAVEAGLLSPCCASGVTMSGTADCAKRRQLELYVTGFEWRAFHESQRTGAALQRLLTLDAAVPIASLTPATNAAEDAHVLGLAHELWLRWRLHSAGRLSQQEVSWYAAEGRQAASPHPVESSLPECAWGTPLLCGAYLYGMQNDYFLNPLVAPGTAALQQQQQLHINGGGDAASSAGDAFVPGHTGEGDGAVAEGGSVISRRRGCYNFLRWRIERYLPRLRAVAASGMDSDVTGHDEARFGDGVRHSNAPLGAPQIDVLVRRVVLSEPVLDVQMDEEKETVQSLAWTDLVEECKSWSTWLSKV